MTKFIEKLKEIAETVAEQKPVLRFFGLVESEDVPNHWDLLVCSDKLTPYSLQALKYIGGLLLKTLTSEEMLRIARFVVLGRDDETIAALLEDQQSEHVNGSIVLWPMREAAAVESSIRQRS
jgi:hypothetical protein